MPAAPTGQPPPGLGRGPHPPDAPPAAAPWLQGLPPGRPPGPASGNYLSPLLATVNMFPGCQPAPAEEGAGEGPLPVGRPLRVEGGEGRRDPREDRGV